MNYGFDNGKFYIDYQSASRQWGNYRQEYERCARELAAQEKNIIIGFTGGLDSQAVVHSFYTQGLEFKTAFLHLPGYNDNEFKQVKTLDEKYDIETMVISFDPIECKEEIEALSKELDIPGKNHLIQRKFVSMLPDDCTFVASMVDPFVFISPTERFYLYQSYYLSEISRRRALNSLNRSGKNIFFGDNIEFFLSIVDDDVFKAAIFSSKYFDENGLTIDFGNLKTLERYDYYIKPIIFGKYWKDELIYFPKFMGYENIDYLKEKTPKVRKYALAYPFWEMMDFFKTPGGVVKRFYENVEYKE